MTNRRCFEFESSNCGDRPIDYSRRSGYDDWKPLLKDAQGVLRTEVILTGKKAIKDCTNSDSTTERMKELSEHGQETFFTTLLRVIPPGDHYKMGDAVEIVRRDISDVRLRRRMLRLMTLIPEKKSLLLAQKAMNYRRIDDVMDAFAKIGLSPVTIGKRNNVNKLDSLYSYILLD